MNEIEAAEVLRVAQEIFAQKNTGLGWADLLTEGKDYYLFLARMKLNKKS